MAKAFLKATWGRFFLNLSCIFFALNGWFGWIVEKTFNKGPSSQE